MIEIATKEGWREHVDTAYERPAPVTSEELRAMSFGDRALYTRDELNTRRQAPSCGHRSSKPSSEPFGIASCSTPTDESGS